MDRHILDRNGNILSTVTVSETRHGTELLFAVEQECREIIDRCTLERNADKLRGHRRVQPYRCVAELPLALVDIFRARGIDLLHDREALRGVLNDPAFKAFRCSEGRV